MTLQLLGSNLETVCPLTGDVPFLKTNLILASSLSNTIGKSGEETLPDETVISPALPDIANFVLLSTIAAFM